MRSAIKTKAPGDQGIMFGYACNETDVLDAGADRFSSHRILKDMAKKRKSGEFKGFGPDSKSQVTLEYHNGQPIRATSVVVSTQHDEDLSQDDVRELVRPHR